MSPVLIFVLFLRKSHATISEQINMAACMKMLILQRLFDTLAVEKMRSPRFWGAQLELIGLSNMLDVSIIVLPNGSMESVSALFYKCIM